MVTIKSYTNIEQSKKLAKILPLESADMCWFEGEPFVEVVTGYEEERAKSHRQAGMEVYPCWSLAALLNIIPKHIMDYNVLRIDINEHDTSIWYDEIGFGVNIELPDITKESTVDACVAMIEKLYESNLL